MSEQNRVGLSKR